MPRSSLIPIILTLQPLDAEVHAVLPALQADLLPFGIRTQIAETEDIPAATFDPARRQYRAEPLLDWLGSLHPRAPRVLGITMADLYADDLNFVFGMARNPGRVAVVALARLFQDDHQERYRQRTLKEVLHELGHTLGLGHCAEPRCVMHFSNSLADTDYKAADFCARCRARLAVALAAG